MRARSGIVLTGWLLAGVAAPCVVVDVCAPVARHACCCAEAGQCTCHLANQRTPAPGADVTTLTTSSHLQSLPAAPAASLPGVRPSGAGGGALVIDRAGERFPPVYLSTHAFRC